MFPLSKTKKTALHITQPSSPDTAALTAKLHSPEAGTTAKFLPFLSHITEGCSVIDVKSSCFIPLYLYRVLCENAVRKLIALQDGDGEVDRDDRMLEGMVSAALSSVVVPRCGNRESYLDEYPDSQCSSKEDIDLVRNSHESWFGNIDGCQCNQALTKLAKRKLLKWANFSWKVICVRHGLAMTEYKKTRRRAERTE